MKLLEVLTGLIAVNGGTEQHRGINRGAKQLRAGITAGPF
jgi:hypothetical protein